MVTELIGQRGEHHAAAKLRVLGTELLQEVPKAQLGQELAVYQGVFQKARQVILPHGQADIRAAIALGVYIQPPEAVLLPGAEMGAAVLEAAGVVVVGLDP